jgi:hypothetical protein
MPRMDESTLCAAVRARIDEGRGEPNARGAWLPLLTLESGARYGIAADLQWIVAPPEGSPAWLEPATLHLLHEALESKRDRFEETLAEGARALEIPSEAVILAFPAVGLVRAVLGKRASYMSRLALLFLLPSELRELRGEIMAVRDDTLMPTPLKDLAARLVVPE